MPTAPESLERIVCPEVNKLVPVAEPNVKLVMFPVVPNRFALKSAVVVAEVPVAVPKIKLVELLIVLKEFVAKNELVLVELVEVPFEYMSVEKLPLVPKTLTPNTEVVVALPKLETLANKFWEKRFEVEA